MPDFKSQPESSRAKGAFRSLASRLNGVSGLPIPSRSSRSKRALSPVAAQLDEVSRMSIPLAQDSEEDVEAYRDKRSRPYSCPAAPKSSPNSGTWVMLPGVFELGEPFLGGSQLPPVQETPITVGRSLFRQGEKVAASVIFDTSTSEESPITELERPVLTRSNADAITAVTQGLARVSLAESPASVPEQKSCSDNPSPATYRR